MMWNYPLPLYFFIWAINCSSTVYSNIIIFPLIYNVTSLVFWTKYFIHLKEREGKRNLPLTGSLPKHPQPPELGQAEAGSLKTPPRPPVCVAESQVFVPSLLPPRVCLIRNLDREAELGLEPRHSNLERGHLKQQPNFCIKCQPLQCHFCHKLDSPVSGGIVLLCHIDESVYTYS